MRTDRQQEEQALQLSELCRPVEPINIQNPVRIFKYVRHEDRAAYERDGWIFAAELGPTHGHYSVLMEKIENTDEHTEKERHGAANARPDARDTPTG